MIDEPGLWEISAEEYHADPCPEPSLNNSLIKLLLQAPAKAKWAHPRLNPLWKPKESNRLDLGSVAHKLLLGRGREVKVLDFPDYRTNAAKEARDEARAAGQIPILGHDFDTATSMESAAAAQLAEAALAYAFQPDMGQSEFALIWKDAAGCWARSLIDWTKLAVEGASWEIWDYKTTDRSARPEDPSLGAHVVDMGYDTQCAMQERGLMTVYPALVGRIKFRLMFQETEPPYLLSVVEPDEATMTMARRKVDYALSLFSHCLQNGWPGYSKGIMRLFHADYLANRWLEREMTEFVSQSDADPSPVRRTPTGGIATGKPGRPKGSKNVSRRERVRLAAERQRNVDERTREKGGDDAA